MRRKIQRNIGACVAATMAVALMFTDVAAAQRLSDAEFTAAIQKLRSQNPDDRIDAVRLLGRRGYRRRREIAPHLRNLLRGDADWRVRAESGRAIGRLSVREAVPDLVRALRDPQVEVRVVAAAALWRLPDAAAVPALVELLDDQDAAARQWAALALGVVRDHRSTQPLLRLLNDSADNVRLDAIRSLGRIGDPEALAGLVAFVNDEDKPLEERLEAVNSLAQLQGPTKVNALARMLSHDEQRVRLRVVRALGQVGDALVLPPLRRRRQVETDAEMREAIDEALRAVQTRMREQAQERSSD